MMDVYIVVNIGCLECGNSTDIEGVYLTQAEAEATGAVARTSLGDDDSYGYWGGSSMLVWFRETVPSPQVKVGANDE